MQTPEPFFFRLSDMAHLTRNPQIHRLLDAIPAFAQVRDSYRTAARDLVLPPEFDHDEAAAAFRDGADLNELADEATVSARRRELQAAASDIVNRARNRHDVEVRDFLRTHQAEISAGIVAGYSELIDKTRELLPALGNVCSIEETLGNPEATVAYSQLDGHARELDEWMHTALELLWPRRTNGYAYAGPRLVLAEYETAWPKFHLEREIYDRDDRGSAVSVAAVSTPWPDSFTLLRDIAARGLKVWAPTQAQYEDETKRLNKIAASLRDDELRAAQSANVVDISPRPSPYRSARK